MLKTLVVNITNSKAIKVAVLVVEVKSESLLSYGRRHSRFPRSQTVCDAKKTVCDRLITSSWRTTKNTLLTMVVLQKAVSDTFGTGRGYLHVLPNHWSVPE